MSEKVTLPKEIATYIEDLLIGGNNEMLLSGVLGNANSPKYIAVRKHFEKDFDSLLKALVNGYEVEQTPEDKVREYYEALQEIAKKEIQRQQANSIKTDETLQMKGIIITLNLLGIKISGVNAE